LILNRASLVGMKTRGSSHLIMGKERNVLSGMMDWNVELIRILEQNPN
jgi:hypothetical protein